MSHTENLFRAKALERKARLDGAVIVRPPMGYRAYVALSAFMGLALLIFIVCGSYAKTKSLVGVISPDRGLSVVAAPEGVVEELYVTEGMQVVKGQRLALISNRRSAVSGDETSAIAVAELERTVSLLHGLAMREKQLLVDELAGLANDEEMIEQDDAALGRQVVAATARLGNAKKRLAAAENLHLQRYLSPDALSEYQDRLFDAQAQFDELQARHKKNLRQLEGIIIKKHQAKLRNDVRLSEIGRQESEIQQRRVEAQASAGLLVTAPTSGTATAISYREGMQTTPGTTLVTIIPAGAKLQVELYVPSAAIPYVREGDWVSLKYRAFPYQRFGMFRGQVLEIPSAMVSPRDTPVGLNLPDEPVFRVLVNPEAQSLRRLGRVVPLQPGMLADVNILTQRRAIWEWMAEPFARQTASGI